MRCRVCHASPATRWAEPSSLTGEGDDPIIATGCAANANKTVAEQATGEELSELALDEARHGAVSCCSLGKKGFEVLLYHSIEQ